MPISVILLLLLLAVASSAVTGFVGFNLGVDHNKATEADKREIVAKAVDAGLNAAASEIAKLTPKHTTIRQTLEKEIRENTIYRDCASSPDSVRAFNSGFSSEPADPLSGVKLPPTVPSE